MKITNLIKELKRFDPEKNVSLYIEDGEDFYLGAIDCIGVLSSKDLDEIVIKGV